MKLSGLVPRSANPASLRSRAIVVLATLALVATRGMADDSTPPPAPGYKTPAEVMAAIATKQLKTISQPKELPAGVVEMKDLEYGKVGERPLKLDLYAPENLTKPVPALVFIHGGAWSGGSRDVYKYYTVRYAKRGYVAVTVSYRLSGEAPFPAALEDVKCAVRWLRANAAKYHVDPGHIAAIGRSAGGHLALLAGYSAGAPDLEGTGGNPGVSSAVQAVVDFYGVYDMTTPFAQKAGSVKKFLGGKTYEEAPELWAKSSPSHYLKAGAPPTLILHGTIDDVVPIEQSDTLARRLKELNVPVTYDRLEGWPHAMDLAEPVNERCQYFMNQFLAKYLPLPK
ncbi:MAG TPA: alpha/beta hydrolase [Verrucomicrobiae bacterium]|nr:alpha/beta hydrolase [Verrucomicrobiae bacterium]